MRLGQFQSILSIVAQGKTLLDWLAAHYPTARRTTLRRMVQSGRVMINGQRARAASIIITDQDRVAVADQAPMQRKPKFPANDLNVIYEDYDLLVVNKPPGLLTATVPREPRPTLLAMVWDYVRAREPRARVGLIHRLDRDAAGLLIFSKTDQAYASLKRQFFRHEVHREYTAVVHGVPKSPKGRIQTRLVERTDGTVHTTRQAGKGEEAITDFELLATRGKKSLLRVILQTGRKHQIRVHLSGRGTPIVGDAVYGPKSDAGPLLLCATKLRVRHPRDDNELTFTIPPPNFFPALLEDAKERG